jgi:hypothetical protein
MPKHVKVKVEHTTIGNRVHAAGEEHFACPDDLARSLESRGQVEILGEGDPARQADYLARQRARGDAAETAVRRGPNPGAVETQTRKG